MTYHQQPKRGLRRDGSQARRRWYAERRARRFVRRAELENPPARSSPDSDPFQAFLETIAERADRYDPPQHRLGATLDR